MILHYGALKKWRFQGEGGRGGCAALSAAHISLGDKKANTLDVTIGNQTNLEFTREYSLTWLASMQNYRNKKNICIRKEFNSHRISLGHQHGHHLIVLGHQYGFRDVMCILSILQSISHVYFPSLSILFLLWKGVGGCVITTSPLSVSHPSIN